MLIEYLVIKNNITRRALKECGFDVEEEALQGPTAVIIAQEEYLPSFSVHLTYTCVNT